jgi:predicted DNA-binding antitoxin AbrB/MazE fold protein
MELELGESLMPITVEATYEDGVLKPSEPLPFSQHERVRITIDADAAWRAGRVRATAGLLGWKGDAETIERVALDPEFSIEEVRHTDCCPDAIPWSQPSRQS